MKAEIGAKLNLSLAVTGKRGNMHTLDMRVCSCDLCDEISTRRKNGALFEVRAEVGGFDEKRFLPVLERCYRTLADRYGESEYAYSVVKRIPPAAGLGGSSAVCAGLVRLFEAEKGVVVDDGLLLSLGSDVPYMYAGGDARVGGTGERVEKLPFAKRYAVILVAAGGVDTARAYALYDELSAGESREGRRDRSGNEGLYFNDLYSAACILNPAVKEAADALETAGGERVVMSGSGSAVCAFFDDVEKARAVFCRFGGRDGVYLVGTTSGFRASDTVDL